MSPLTDAEMVLGLSRHLSAFQASPAKAALDNLEVAGWVLDMAFRLRGSLTNSPQRIEAIGLDVGLGRRALRDVMATLEAVGWVAIQRDASNTPVAIEESVPVPTVIVASLPSLLRILSATPAELAAIELLRSTTLRPLLKTEALHVACLADGVGGDAAAAEQALRSLVGIQLVRLVAPEDDGREVIYNPNVWTQGDSVAETALRAADARATSEVTALIEEIAESPGIAEIHVKSTESKWVRFAISQGLVERSVIQTTDGSERGFLFTPHVARDPFGGTAGDASGQVRQLVGSMIYAATFAQNKLTQPDVFLRALINRGIAGNATSIGSDYPMLEKAGIVRVLSSPNAGRFRLELLQPEVAQEALKLMVARATPGSSGNTDARILEGQNAYSHVERERAKLAIVPESDRLEEARLLAALREVPLPRPRGPR